MNLKRTAQNLIEFVFVFPLLIIILFGILEFGVFYRNAHVIEDIATEAAVSASRKLVYSTMTSDDITNANFNIAAKAAKDVVMKRRGVFAPSDLTFAYIDTGTQFGTRPYALYRIDSNETRMIDGILTPIVSIVIDYRNPEEDGITVQLIYQYRTMLVGASFPVLGGAPIVIIPRDITISSAKIKQYITY